MTATQTKPYSDLLQQGFMIISIPKSIRQLCQQHVIHYFKTLNPNIMDNDTHSLPEQLTQITLSYSNEEFVEHFIKGLRTFPLTITQSFIPWIQTDIQHLLMAKNIALTHISQLDQRNNASLTAEDFDVYWRCVRPLKQDIGKPHTDRQFAQLNEGSDRAIPLPFKIRERWRIWFPLFGCHNQNSIQLIKNSADEHIPFSYIDTINGPRPNIEPWWINANEHRFECPIHDDHSGVLFRDDVVHRGPMNQGPDVRISAEFTIIVQ